MNHPLFSGQILTLPRAVVQHLHALRLHAGASITLFNGQGGEYAAQITQLNKRAAQVAIERFTAPSRESALRLSLVQALSAADRMDYTIQKATELGVTSLHPIRSAYCAARLPQAREAKRLAHWQAVAIAAAEQSGRTLIPSISALQNLADYLALPHGEALKLILSPNGTHRLQQLPDNIDNIHVLIGPEGGFSAAEEQQALAQGYLPLIIGPRLLRTETVAPVIAALLQARYGDI